MIRTVDLDNTTPQKVVYKQVTAKEKAAETLVSCLNIALEFPEEQIGGWDEMTKREQTSVWLYLNKHHAAVMKIIEKSLPD